MESSIRKGKMAKRVADKELTDRNWDQEEEVEEAGTFSVASRDVLKNREIKKAKRRNLGSDSEKGGAFKGFQGLVSSGSSFAGFGSVSKPQVLTNGNGGTSLFSNAKPAADSKTVFGSLFANGPPKSLSSPTEVVSTAAKTNGETLSSTSPSPTPSKPGSSSEYNKQLMSLNCAVRDWIVKHVNATPLCDLTPIFRDYEKHLASIEQKYGAVTDSGSESDSTSKLIPSVPTLVSSNAEAKPTFSFTTSKEEKSEQPAKSKTEMKTESASLFSFSQKSDTANFSSFGSGSAATFSFKVGTAGLSKDTSKNSAATPTFSFQSDTSTKSEESGGGEEEEAEEPPKVVIQQVKEDDAFYSKKCKLFYKKDNEFKEKGVGTLHLKPVKDQKTQLLVRADTNLGNILLNILVQPSMPCSRMGKNNVMIVCVPNPPIDEKNPSVPVSMLIRVKATEDADELHKLLQDKKGT